jgi:DNA (cytosine-5)-methyltransferase 1
MQRGLPDLLERHAVIGTVAEPVLLPTPTASHYGFNQSASAGAAVRPSLATLAARRLLPTSTLSDPATEPGHDGDPRPGSARHGHRAGSRPEALLPTPRGSDRFGPGGHGQGGPDLRTALLLPTPRATDGAKGCPAQRGSKGDLTLPAAAVRLDPPAFSTVEDAGVGGWGPYTEAVARWAALLGRPAPAPTQPGQHGKPVLAPAFVEWLMGLPAGWVTDLPLPRTLALRVLGNGVVPQQAAAALRLLLCPHRWAVPS